MLNVLPVKKENFNEVYPLFEQIPTPAPLAKERWRNLFNRQWDCQVEPLGYVLMNANEIAGYIGLITVERKIHEQRHRITGLTSWTVNKQYGGHAIKLIFPFIRDQERTLTCFTPAKSVDAVFRRFGFQELNAFLQVIPFWVMPVGQKDYQISFDIEQHRPILTKGDWQIYCDHRQFASEHFILKNGKTYCYVVAKRILKKRLPFLHIHYISDKEQFREGIQKFVAMICYRTKTLGLIIFDSYLGYKKVTGAIRIKMPDKPLFRSPTLPAEDVDSLYSEFFVLDF